MKDSISTLIASLLILIIPLSGCGQRAPQRRGSVFGVVKDSETGYPIERVEVEIDGWSSVTDKRGEYRIDGIGPVPDDYEITALKKDYEVYRSTINVDEGENLWDFVMSKNLWPSVKIEAYPTSGKAPLMVSFRASVSDPDGVIVSYTWDFNGDGKADSYDQNPSYEYKKSGTYKASVTVTDDGGGIGSDSIVITVLGNEKPVALASASPTSGDAPLTVNFNGEGYDSDGYIVSYSWDFETDGTTDSFEKDTTHTYTLSGIFTATFTVRDNEGAKGVDTVVITVTSKVEPPSEGMVFVSGGEFTMGSETGEEDERPSHKVYLDPFWIDKYEVTNREFAEFLNSGNKSYYDNRMEIEEGWNGKYVARVGFEDHPAVYVDWYSSKAYCEWCGKSLPTEAEWEKAARGTDRRTYPWGEGMDGRRANYWGSGDPYDNWTTPVGYYNGVNEGTLDSPSPYGAYDMSGNVWEWVNDWYREDYYTYSPYDNPKGPASGSYRVVRGGSWIEDPPALQTSNREYFNPSSRFSDLGFRCAK